MHTTTLTEKRRKLQQWFLSILQKMTTISTSGNTMLKFSGQHVQIDDDNKLQTY
jgi:hypothetical protein